MARKRAGSEDERLDNTSIERVIAYLKEPKATKKVACQMLNISYNVTRLDKLIETYKQRKELEIKRRAEKLGKPATPEEVAYIVTEYLAGASFTEIGNALYRGTTFIKTILEKYSVPERNSTHDYFKPRLIPEEAIKDKFSIGELVYAARYDTLATIEHELIQGNDRIYRVWLKGDWQQYAYQPSWELAGLDTLRAAGITL